MYEMEGKVYTATGLVRLITKGYDKLGQVRLVCKDRGNTDSKTVAFLQ